MVTDVQLLLLLLLFLLPQGGRGGQGRGRGLGCGRLGGRLWLQLPFSYLFPILKLSCQLSKAQA